jgi:hypothetical protein
MRSCALFIQFLAWALLCSFGALRAQDSPDAAEAGPSDSQDAVSFQTFYDSLSGQGTWIQTDAYGYVWQPTVTDPAWAPYTDGHWVYTEAGWTWVSDEPWGWATYHYGRWVNLDGTGWCWVPGYTWGPAWVSWRYGDGYCGWAPLPPDSLVGVDYADGADDSNDGFHIGGDCDSYYGIGAGWYNFLPIGYLGDSDYRGYYANRYNNYRLINRTTNVTNLNVNRRGEGNFDGVTLGGPSFLQANAQSQTPITRADLAFTDRVGGGAVNGRSLELFAPRIDIGTVRTARPASFARTTNGVNVNRGTDVSRPLQVTSRLSTGNPTAGQVEQAQLAQRSAPMSANVATMNTAVHSFSGTPLTSMRPMTSLYEVRPSGERTSRDYSTSGGYGASTNPRLYSSGVGHFSSSPYGHSSSGVHGGGTGGGSSHVGGADSGSRGR